MQEPIADYFTKQAEKDEVPPVLEPSGPLQQTDSSMHRQIGIQPGSTFWLPSTIKVIGEHIIQRQRIISYKLNRTPPAAEKFDKNKLTNCVQKVFVEVKGHERVWQLPEPTFNETCDGVYGVVIQA